MKKNILHFLLYLCTIQVMAQSNENLALIANVNDYASEQYNDIWGYVDEDGTEYAVLGTRRATVIYSLENPAQPTEVAYIPGSSSIWRDFKSFGSYIYVTADQGNDGLLVIDMTNAPEDITWEFWKPNLVIGERTDSIQLRTCHNLYIDENGFCYLSGCNMNEGGILILDVATTPGTPIFIDNADPRYSHDNFVRGDTIWSSDISSGVFSVIDVSDKRNPVTITTQQTSNRFTHNAWLSDDGNYLFTTDERSNSYVDAYDVSDLDNIRLLDKFQPYGVEGKGVIPHNVHYYNGFLVTSWYTEGLIITDANRPNNMVQVGNYDTFGGASGGTEGCWGAYPFLPSGLILASDVVTGLYVFQPNYTRACYLEGKVTDATTGMALDDVRIELLDENENVTASDFSGDYKMGTSTAGIYEVQFIKPGYNRFTTNVTLENGVITIADVSLKQAASYDLTGRIIDATDGSGIPGASVVVQNELYFYETVTDLDGNFRINGVYEETYQFYGGKWGFKHNNTPSLLIERSENIVLELESGYQDDFIFDFQWTSTTDTAITGLWTRGVPIGTVFFGEQTNPGADIEGDLGDQCYVTGNFGNSAAFDDVDDGNVFLTSPSFDLTNLDNPTLRFHYWFFNAGGNETPDDSLAVYFTDGTDTVLVDAIRGNAGGWVQSQEYPLADFLTPSDNMKIIFVTGDQRSSGHLVEAGIDNFLILSEEVISSNEDQRVELGAQVYPNPSNSGFNLALPPSLSNFNVRVFNALGQQVLWQEVNDLYRFGANWEAGVYYVRIENSEGKYQLEKVIKVK